MGPKSRAFARYRPRFVTLVVLCVVAAPIVVANLSHDEVPSQAPPAPNPSYGWPLIWYECKFKPSSTPPGGGVAARMDLDLTGWSGPRLAGNLAIWFVILAITGAACEWLLRRFRTPFRCRPRFVTLIVLMIVAAPMVLANLSQDQSSLQAWWKGWRATSAHGWPLTWYWCTFKPGSALPAGAMPTFRLDFARWSASRLTGNLAIWLSTLSVIGAGCEWWQRRHRPASSHRPRLLTPIVLIVVTALIVLANLNYDQRTRFLGFERFPSYGWPLMWRWRNVYVFYGSIVEHDRNYSTARLTVNLAMWLGTLAAAGRACEWLLRRYRPRLWWSLRTMLAAVGVAAAFCAWFAALRDRADVQDPIVSAHEHRDVQVILERWGPKWLDVVGADRFRRRVVGVFLNYSEGNDELLKCLGRLPDLRYLKIDISQMGPGMAAVSEMRQLRMLRIACWTDDVEGVHEALVAVCKLTRLERLCLDECEVLGSNDLRCLRGLTRLKSLTLTGDLDEDAAHECLAAVGELTQLERLCLEGLGHVRSDDLACLAGLTKLKSLMLAGDLDEDTSHECLAVVGKLTQLERLCLDVPGLVRSDGLAHLAGLTNLRALGLRNSWTDGSVDEEQMEEIVEDLAETGRLHMLTHLPALPRLETIDLEGSTIGDDLSRLAVLPRLKSLNLTGTSFTAAVLAALAPLESLEELAIDNRRVTSAAGLYSLFALTHLKALHIDSTSRASGLKMGDRLVLLQLDGGQMFVRKGEVDRCRQALEALRQSNPGIVIDSDTDVFNERRRQSQGR